LANLVTVSFSRRTLLHGVTSYWLFPQLTTYCNMMICRPQKQLLL